MSKRKAQQSDEQRTSQAINGQRLDPIVDVQRLRDNAITSIRLGIEDFERSQRRGQIDGDPARALSAVRNLVAGVLLLFKYQIAKSVDDPADAARLLFIPPDVLPHADGKGGIEWRPTGKFRDNTIDVSVMQKRFATFGITFDWAKFGKLKECRNDLEHLHPASSLGDVADLVAGLFPVLRDFITDNMDESPAEVLGEAWQIMLKHHEFIVNLREQCDTAWDKAKIPEGMQPWRVECHCAECGSSLLTASPSSLQQGLTVERDDDAFEYVCLGCGNADLIAPELIEALHEAYPHDFSSGEDSDVATCDVCDHGTFLRYEQACLWCQASLRYSTCGLCGEGLDQDDQHNAGLCAYHADQAAKVMRE
jgi:hypothetical protein